MAICFAAFLLKFDVGNSEHFELLNSVFLNTCIYFGYNAFPFNAFPQSSSLFKNNNH